MHPNLPPGCASLHLIETVRVGPNRAIPLLGLHLNRLRRSCAALRVPWPDTLPQAINAHVVELNPAENFRLRVLVNHAGGHSVQVQTLPATALPVRVVLADEALAFDPFWIAHKTTFRPWYARAGNCLQQHPEVFDVLYCNARDEVCEGSRTNIYMRDDAGQWLTPPATCGLLPGVQRQALIDQGVVREAVITRTQLMQAQHMRVSNALRGWIDAVLWNAVKDTARRTRVDGII